MNDEPPMVVCNKCGYRMSLSEYVDIGFCPQCGLAGYVNDEHPVRKMTERW
jgi:uncharacterized CHY-type Zn-finger protein